jgi:hypothetical protein
LKPSLVSPFTFLVAWALSNLFSALAGVGISRAISTSPLVASP